MRKDIPWQCIVLLHGHFEDGQGEKREIFIRLADSDQLVKVHDLGHHDDKSSVLFMLSERERLFSEVDSWFWCYPLNHHRKNGVCVAVYMNQPPVNDPPEVGILRFCGILNKKNQKITLWVGRKGSSKSNFLELEDPQNIVAEIAGDQPVEGTASLSTNGTWQIETCDPLKPPKPKKRVKTKDSASVPAALRRN